MDLSNPHCGSSSFILASDFCKVFCERGITGRGFSVLICLYKPNSANASISVVISILFIFMMLFLICPCNSGFLPTLEQGVSTVYMCRRAHSATCSVSLDERSQAGLTDGSNVYSFPILHQARIFKNKSVSYSGLHCTMQTVLLCM